MFGNIWVDKLGEAFFALNEDRKYLSNIVEQLVKEAERAAAINWASIFSTTADRKDTSEERTLDLLFEVKPKRIEGVTVVKVPVTGPESRKDKNKKHENTHGAAPL